MKKTITWLAALYCIVALTGCSKSVDDQFIDDVKKTLEEKSEWKHNMENSQKQTDLTMESFYKKEASFEPSLYMYFNQDFEDVKLKELANEYLEGVKEKESAVQNYESDHDFAENDDFIIERFEGERRRIKALKQIIQGKYGLKSDAYDVKYAELENSIDEIVNNLNEKKQSGSTYSINLKNTTKKNWENFWINLDLVDSNGEKVESLEPINESLKAKETLTLTFESQNIESISVKCSSYSVLIDDGEESYFIANKF